VGTNHPVPCACIRVELVANRTSTHLPFHRPATVWCFAALCCLQTSRAVFALSSLRFSEHAVPYGFEALCIAACCAGCMIATATMKFLELDATLLLALILGTASDALRIYWPDASAWWLTFAVGTGMLTSFIVRFSCQGVGYVKQCVKHERRVTDSVPSLTPCHH